jgi:adenylate cyclase
MSKRFPILLGFVLVAISVWLQITSVDYVKHLLIRLENLAYDIQLRTKVFTHKEPPQTNIAIVDIDDKSLAAEGRWPWPRSRIADLITQLQKQGAVVIGIDMIFPEREDNIATLVMKELDKQNLSSPEIKPLLKKIEPFFDNDFIFANSLSKSDIVMGISFLPDKTVINELPPPILKLTTPEEQALGFVKSQGVISNLPIIQTAAKNGGFINVYADNDGIIRRVPLLINYNNNLYPSLALEAVRLYLLSNVKVVTANYGSTQQVEGVEIGDNIIPTDASGQAIIPFRGKSFTFPYLPAIDVLNKKIPDSAIQGKIIFIGTSATGLGDLPATAIQSAYPGVEIHATVADGILSHNFSLKPAWSLGAEVFLTVFLGISFSIIFAFLGPRTLTLLIILLPTGLVFANNWLWEHTGLIISIFVPMILFVILGLVNFSYGYLFETRRRERLKNIFGQYVPAKHIDEMLHSTSDYGMLGEEREMTVLFADIRHFTTISEHLPASQLKELLNEFFTPMTEIIFKYSGTIDKYVGDLIMAFWGAPLKDKKHAQHAIAAALEMQQAVKRLYPILKAHGWPKIHIGIGLNSGLMSVGDMGSKFRRNYTVLGDAVNLASRIESLTKFYGARLIVTENTSQGQKHFIFRQLDRVRVKGKQSGIAIYEVMGKRGEISPELTNEIEINHRALQHYFHREWDNALELFSQLKSLRPKSKLYSIYLKRIIAFKKNPPPEQWDGVYTHLMK